jgi:hypothetical protein
MITVQLCCLIAGIYLLTEGDMFFGLFNIIINVIFIPVNIDTLRECD